MRQDLKFITQSISNFDDGYFQICEFVAMNFPANLAEVLNQLVNGPVWDGDIISKTDRDELIELKLAVRVCCKGEEGYTGATYTGYTINKKYKEFKNGDL